MSDDLKKPVVRIPKERIDRVEQLILSLRAPVDFVPELAAEWQRSTRQVWTYVRIARARIAERARANVAPEADREVAKRMVIEAFGAAKIGGVNGPNAAAMVAAAKVYAELTGAAAPQKVELSGKGVLATVAVYLPPEDNGGAAMPACSDVAKETR